MAEAGLVFALAFAAGVIAQGVAWHLRMPAIVILLALGVALGPDGVGWIQPDELGDGLQTLVGVAVAVILFEGALNLDLRRIRREQAAIRMLLTVGAAITALGATLAAHSMMAWPWERSLVFGTLVIVTGPTVIRPILRNVPLRPRLATVLEAEGVLIDPIGAIVAAVTLEVVLVPPEARVAAGLPGLLLALAFGTSVGLVFGYGLGRLLRSKRVVPEGLENISALAVTLVLFEGCNQLVHESGILAVTVAGVVVGNMRTRVGRELGDFEEHLTLGLLGILFILLAADVRLAHVGALGWQGWATVASLVFVVRPLNVFACTTRSDLDWREKLFLCWTAPRGIVAAAVASLAAVLLDSGGDALRALVFLTIAVTVVVQGASAPFVATALRVRAPGREAVAILGAEELGLALAEALRRGGVPVVLLDANPTHCQAAQERGFRVIYGNALELRTLARARLERARAAVGLTANEEVNSLFAREAGEDFDVPETYVALRRAGKFSPRILEKQASRTLFDGPKDVERWNVRLRHGAVETATFRVEARSEDPADAGERERGSTKTGANAKAGATSRTDPFLLLTVERGGSATPVHAELELRPEDAVVVMIHTPERDAALSALAQRGLVLAAESEAERAG